MLNTNHIIEWVNFYCQIWVGKPLCFGDDSVRMVDHVPTSPHNSTMTSANQVIQCDHLVLNQALKTVTYKDQKLSLSPTSFELLTHLMLKAPAVVSVDQLLEQVWQKKVVSRDTVKQQVKSLRDQLGEAATLIESVRGFGYQIKTTTHTVSGKTWQHRKWWFVGMAVLVIMAAVLYHYLTRPTMTLPLETATLPFKLIDSNDQDLVVMLQEELTQMLARQADVRAIAVSALEHADEQKYSPKEYAQHLNVDVMFEGSVRELDEGYQVNMRMVWTHNSVAVWREHIDVAAKDRELLVAETTEALRSFIIKKVAYIKRKTQ